MVDVTKSAGAPEIEVTPEMIEAGVRAFYGEGGDSWDDPRILREALKEIFKAMSRRQPVRA